MLEKFKGYSKEEYDKAEEDAKHARRTLRNIGGGRYEGGRWIRFAQVFYDDLIKEIEKAEKKAESRVEKLKGKAHKEALKLNKEYQKKLQTVRDALEDLDEFEREQLDMHEEEGEPQE